MSSRFTTSFPIPIVRSGSRLISLGGILLDLSCLGCEFDFEFVQDFLTGLEVFCGQMKNWKVRCGIGADEYEQCLKDCIASGNELKDNFGPIVKKVHSFRKREENQSDLYVEISEQVKGLEDKLKHQRQKFAASWLKHVLDLLDEKPDLSLKNQAELLIECLRHYKYFNPEQFQSLIDKINVNARFHQCGNINRTPLHCAIWDCGCPKIVKMMLDGSEPSQREVGDDYGYLSLHLAIEKNNIECVKLLLKDSNCSQREAGNYHNKNALHIAAEGGCDDILKLLLIGMPSHYRLRQDWDGCTSIHAAAANRNVECLKLLLEGRDAFEREITDFDEATPLHLALKHGRFKSAKLLLNGSRTELRDIRNKDSLRALDLMTYIKHPLHSKANQDDVFSEKDGCEVFENVNEMLFKDKKISENVSNFTNEDCILIFRLLWPNLCAPLMYILDKESTLHDEYFRFWANDTVVKNIIKWFS